MADQNFTNFTFRTPISADFLVGYKADGSEEFRTTVSQLLSTRSIDYIPVTYTQLRSLSASNSLIPGRYYFLTDFVTEYSGNGTNNEWISPSNPLPISQNAGGIPIPVSSIAAKPEPLILQAIAPNKILHQAFSPQYPRDIIYYDPDFTYIDGIHTSKGYITYRRDTYQEITAFYDWRNVRFKRFYLSPSSFPALSASTFYKPGDVAISGDTVGMCVSALTTPSSNPTLAYPGWCIFHNIKNPTPFDSITNFMGFGTFGSPLCAMYYNTFSTDDPSLSGDILLPGIINVYISPVYPTNWSLGHPPRYSYRMNNITFIRRNTRISNTNVTGAPQIRNVYFEPQNSNMVFYINDNPTVTNLSFGVGSNNVNFYGGAAYNSQFYMLENCIFYTGSVGVRYSTFRNNSRMTAAGSVSYGNFENNSGIIVNQTSYNSTIKNTYSVVVNGGSTFTWDIQNINGNFYNLYAPEKFAPNGLVSNLKMSVTQGSSLLPYFEFYDIDDIFVRTPIFKNLVYLHSNNQILSRLASVTAANFKDIYTTQNHTLSTYVRNPECWCYDLASQMSCISPWNNKTGSPGGVTGGGVLITPRHVYMTVHFPLSAGNIIRFVTDDNQVVDRTIVRTYNHPSYNPTTSYPDIRVGLLDSDVPSSIKPCKVLNSSFTKYLPETILNSAETWVPSPRTGVLYTDQQEKALVTDLQAMIYPNNFSPNNGLTVFIKPTNTVKLSAYEQLVSGDSGNPAFLIINNELALVTLWTSVLNDNFYGTAYNLLEINPFNNMMSLQQMISTIDIQQGSITNYQVSAINLDGFDILNY